MWAYFLSSFLNSHLVYATHKDQFYRLQRFVCFGCYLVFQKKDGIVGGVSFFQCPFNLLYCAIW